MKQIIIILTIILGILLLGVAGLFTWNQYENNQIKKMEFENTQKNEDKKDNATKKTPSKKDNSNELANTDDNNSTETQVDGNNEVTSTEEAVPEQEQVTEEQSVDENGAIANADKNGDGLVTTDEMTPELWELAKQGKFQPMSPEMANPENHKPYEEDTEASSEDEEMRKAYERQKKIYDLQARGVLPQPGERPITEE
ncbi:hypothetical protein [Staphylococcus xylosus]